MEYSLISKEEYQEIVQRYKLKPKKLLNASLSFFMGGLLSFLAEGSYLLISKFTNLESKNISLIIILVFIFISSLLTGIGIYDKLAQKFGAGLFIPITGFANALTSQIIDGKSEGLIYGIGSSAFKLVGSVIYYGIISAVIVSLISAWFNL